MDVTARIGDPFATGADTVAVGVITGADPGLPEVRALVASGEAKPTPRHLAVTHRAGVRIIAVGLGDREALDGERARVAAALAGRRARELGCTRLTWALPPGAGDEIVDGLVSGTVLGAYRFTRYRPGADGDGALTALTIAAADRDVSGAASRAFVLAEAQNRARELGNRPPNDLDPETLATYAIDEAGRLDGVTVDVFGRDDLELLGMGAFLAVAQGAAVPPRMIALRYEGPGVAADAPLLGLIGKAVTFDTGGLSLKTGTGMMGMKFDMAGGAAVLEAIGALARLHAPVRVLGVVGATENAVSARSMRPDDIVTTMDGTTVEIDNTDAEGRLVLGDCVTWARRQGCAAIVDIATLTGAIVIALGSPYAGLFASDDTLAAQLIACGERTSERVWRMPLGPEYAELIKGRYAQITNRSRRREAMSITAAEFIHHFAGDTPWAHLDIAAVGDDSQAPYLDKGGTGFGVRLLAELAIAFGG